MFRNILYYINPISGTANKKKLISIISAETSKRDIKFEIAYTQKDGNYGFLKNKIKEEQITDIVICGGDGTISNITSFLIGENVQVGIVPMGSGNGLAYAAGISRKIKKALHTVFVGKATWIDGFYINGHFGCMLSGLGFDAQVAHDFANQKKRGLITYIIQAIKNYFTPTDCRFIIEANNQQITTKALFVSIANSNQFGNHVKIAPKASLSDGLLDIIIVPKMNKIITFFFLLKHLFKGELHNPSEKGLQKKKIFYLQSDVIKITNESMAPLHVDGEPIETAAIVEIKVVPTAFKLIQPESIAG